MTTRAIDRLTHLLEVERAALLLGDLEAVGALAEEKEALATSFEGTQSDDLAALSGALERNGALLAAAQQGVSTVLATLRNQRAARESLSTYDSAGKAKTIGQASQGTVRRF